MHGTLHPSSCVNFVSNPYCAIYKRFIIVIIYFSPHNPKRHLKFLKLIELMKEKGKKILWNVTTCWINLLSPTKKVMTMYMTLLAKMVEDDPSIMFAKVNFELLCDVNLSSLFFVCCPHLRNSQFFKWYNLIRSSILISVLVQFD